MPAFLSVYIHDIDFDVQSNLRSQTFAGVYRALLTNLAIMLNQRSTYVQSFLTMHELARDNAPTDPFMLTRDLQMCTCVAAMGRLALKLLRDTWK